MELITTELVALDADLGADKEAVIGRLAQLVEAAGRADARGLTADVLARETKAVTGMKGGFAIPHCRSAAVSEAALVFARLARPVEWGAKDGPADLVFLIAAAEDGDADHLKLLTKLARALVRKDFLASLRGATSDGEVVALIDGVVNPSAENAVGSSATSVTTPAENDAGRDIPSEGMTAAGGTSADAAAAGGAGAGAGERQALIVAVTACPTGIAHTYMAADALAAEAKEQGIALHVETQGSGEVTPIAAATIARADAAIFATDVGVKDMERFAGLPVVRSGVKRAINEPGVMLEEALAASRDPNASRVGGVATKDPAGEGSEQLSLGKRVMQALMTGVSYMLPFVAAGGLLIALGFLLGGFDLSLAPGSGAAVRTCVDLTWADAGACAQASSIADLALATGWGAGATYLGAVLFSIGGAAFGFLVPALSGYIAYGIAGRPGIAPGFVGGAISVTLGAGFIGGLLTGLLAGGIAQWLAKRSVPRWLAGLMPVVVIPLVTSLVVGGLMFLLLGRPIAALTVAMQDGLGGMSGGSRLLLGALLGLMMCFDLGGPVNKAAYLFATAGLSPDNTASLQIMAAVMASGMVPPIAMSLATFVRKSLFTKIERENGQSAWLLGLAFISEGAIPFAAADPLRVIPSMMAGGAVTGALTMALGVGSFAPHGGVFVFFAIQNFGGFLVSVIAGVIVALALVVALKMFTGRRAASPTATDPALAR